MSEAHIGTHGSLQAQADADAPAETRSTHERSFIENFVDSFFQEKNIKWMLVVGAAIVFGSSLMLVTKAWPSWPGSLRFLTILAYTSVIYGAAEVGRRRLGLTATYKVLYSLTLLLLPVCFMALHWLSANSATQSWHIVELCGLMLPATAFLWFASSRILDHVLRGRQTTFLISYCLLCAAGALPEMAGPLAAFLFTACCWLVFSAGVMKVNRHTFWLAEEHRLPRIFGFLPIAMLGLQFIVLIGTKAFSQLHTQWIGFGCVMVAATVLVTARTVADVFRQRTGDLVRPLPWNIAVPLFSGLVLTALGMALSFNGFSYSGETSYTVIPTAIVATVLMWMAARDTRHSGFVWAGMICATIAYQCSPTLFSDIVQSLKDSTAAAMHRERVPFSLYGVTYLPLLGFFAAASRWFANCGERQFSQPLKHFVTVVSLSLFFVAVTDRSSMLIVALANVPVFLIFGHLFRDRRYVLPALAAIVLATGVAIPALSDMGYVDISFVWVPTVLAGLAAVMTATTLPDRLINRISINGGSTVGMRDNETGKLIPRSFVLQTADGGDRCLAQLVGFALAGVMSAHWIGYSLTHFQDQLSQPALLQYVFLMSAFILYTLKNPRYLSGCCLWAMLAFAAVRWAVGLAVPTMDVLSAASFITACTSLLGYVWLKLGGQMSRSTALCELRRELGFDAETFRVLPPDERASSGWARQVQAFVVPLCDLSLVILSCLAACVHLPLLLKTHLLIVSQPTAAVGSLALSTAVTVLWLTVATVVFRSRTAGIAATVALPLLSTAAIASIGIPLAPSWLPVIWGLVEGLIFVVCSRIAGKTKGVPVISLIARVSEVWLQALLLLSCLSFAVPMRVAAAISLVCFLVIDHREKSKYQIGYLAVMANVQSLLLAAGIAGCSGAISTLLTESYESAIPLIFLTCAISVLFFDRRHSRIDQIIAQTWTALLRAFMVTLGILSLGLDSGNVMAITMTAGFAVAMTAESIQAIRRQEETHVWTAVAIGGCATLFLYLQDVISLGVGKSQFVLLGLSAAGLMLAYVAQRNKKLAIIRRPMYAIGQILPTLVAIMAIAREFSGAWASVTVLNALALMIAAGIYFQQAMANRSRNFALMAAIIMNAGLMLLWRSLQWTAPEFYLVPVGLSVLAFVELLKKELPGKSHDPLRYIGALTILVSPMFQVLDGDWAHMLTLMVLSVVVILAAIGLRIRVLVYAGSAFLLADLVAMVVHGTIANPILLWVGGVALGIAVIALAAFCENHREKLLSRIRFVSAELATWN